MSRYTLPEAHHQPKKGDHAMTDQQQFVKVTGHQLPSNIG